jgi:general L-amino acid transport system permease protein
MMQIFKPNRDNLNTSLSIGLPLIILAFIDFFGNTFLNTNITEFLPNTLSYFFPLLIGSIGLYFIRIEYSGIRILDNFNKSVNSTTFNALLTLLIIFILFKYTPPLLDWLIFDANFIGSTKEDCTSDGACWVFVKVWFKRFMYGMYPNPEQWRINTAFLILFTLIGAAFFVSPKYKKYVILFMLFIYPIIGIKLISGGIFGLKWIETGAWGGLSLTLIVSAFALILCFPIGMFLALGRRSELPVIKYSSIGFIEIWRGVPLITVLFMSAVMFPMFLPDGTYMDKLMRVIIAITLFEAAYMAEVIRGGLQALPRGQYDAAKSLGMGYWRMHLLVILPQALKLGYSLE